ncbi:uncharacterized protein B0I36DRAFT_326725 [Microdochium trichocladiopsis]|uniref:Uncharacterized protein n=1 Tax=Microdochium trichocladiopsis TaxID=1682393 RepID=A0A9P8Y1N4_9PEZI|nr:uncharacterized protein B0I36DRAFT_326725 [Microdochium trichocladiopsis]KAH7027244.1 hypothetical protein B0I36DRAFT_326725 [Microdochium trichocladiopsis]
MRPRFVVDRWLENEDLRELALLDWGFWGELGPLGSTVEARAPRGVYSSPGADDSDESSSSLSA